MLLLFKNVLYFIYNFMIFKIEIEIKSDRENIKKKDFRYVMIIDKCIAVNDQCKKWD